MKKKNLISVFLLSIILIFTLPFIFHDKLIKILKENIKDNFNAKIEFKNVDLSFIKSFPDAYVSIKDVLIINNKPFEGDTLFYSKKISVDIKITDLIRKKDNTISIKYFNLENAKINIITNLKGQSNYNITKNSSEKKQSLNTNNNPYNLELKKYKISNTNIYYKDLRSKIIAKLINFNHSGTGNFSSKESKINTKTATNINFEIDNKKYINNVYFDLNALLNINLENNTFSFLKNKAHINKLPLIFNGFVKTNKNNKQVNINFKTPYSKFDNFLALIPKTYAKKISDVKTTGDFTVVGNINGKIDSIYVPKFDIEINSKNASAKYTSLPKSIKNINIDTKIINKTGLIKNTIININNFSFKIDNNTFKSKAIITNLINNPNINANLNGVINLSDIEKVYPTDKKNELSGIIKADLTTSFDLDALKKSIHSRIKNKGDISITNFIYASKEIAKPINIKNAKINFTPSKIKLTQFNSKTGSTDLNASGTINNFLGFLLSDKKLKGEFSLQSNVFKIDDFITNNDKKDTNDNKKNNSSYLQESLKIPDFLDCSITASSKKVYYDNLELKNVKGSLIIKKKNVIFKKINANIFDGIISLNGIINTQKKIPSFNMKLNIKSFNIGKSFDKLNLFKKIAPIAKIFDGKLNTKIDLKGNLKNDLTPNLNTITGNAFNEIVFQKLNPKKSKFTSLLNNKVDFIDFSKININNIKTYIDFKNGKVNVKPFNIKYKDININIGGYHGFDQSMKYDVDFDVPTKYLGNKISNLVKNISNNKNIKIPIKTNISGGFTKPIIKTNLNIAIHNLKNKLINNGINNFFNKKSKKNNYTKKSVKKILNGNFFNKKKN